MAYTDYLLGLPSTWNYGFTCDVCSRLVGGQERYNLAQYEASETLCKEHLKELKQRDKDNKLVPCKKCGELYLCKDLLTGKKCLNCTHAYALRLNDLYSTPYTRNSRVKKDKHLLTLKKEFLDKYPYGDTELKKLSLLYSKFYDWDITSTKNICPSCLNICWNSGWFWKFSISKHGKLTKEEAGRCPGCDEYWSIKRYNSPCKKSIAACTQPGKRLEHVYVLSNKEGEVLYVGRTYSLQKRLFTGISSHKATKDWFTDIYSIRVSTYVNVNQSDEAERHLIKDLNPIFNKSRLEPVLKEAPKPLNTVTGLL